MGASLLASQPTGQTSVAGPKPRARCANLERPQDRHHTGGSSTPTEFERVNRT